MKALLRMFLIALVLSPHAWADIDHKASDSDAPDAARISSNRACFQEAQALGCGHPRDDQESFVTCLGDRKDDLTAGCRTMLGKLYLP
jgi:hypothetical protein